jgi:DNA-binding SARP family transcriptional activator/tetratricopeptide (TPR) repeat protein
VHTLALRLLGDFSVDGVEPHALGGRKGRTLLWMLALGRGQSVPADSIVEALWPDDPPAKPFDQVAVLTSRLRSVIGRDRIDRGDAGYRLTYDWLDVDELASLMSETDTRLASGNVAGAAAAARISLSLLGNRSITADVGGGWAETRLADLDRLLTRCRRTATLALLQAGSSLDAADAASTMLGRDPYDEDALRLYMRANAAAGRSAAALAAYAEMRDRLTDDLGTDPSPETAGLHTAILRGELVASEPPRARVSSPATPFVGRESEIAHLDSAADRATGGAIPLVVVDGEAGIGKTSLLRAWAASRSASGNVVLFATCGDLAHAAPLDPLLSVLNGYLRDVGESRAAELLGPDAAILAPLFGLAPATTLPTLLADGIVGPTLLYSALGAVIERLGRDGLVVLVFDDAHRGGAALGEWLQFMRRRRAPLIIVTSVRTGEGTPMQATDVVELGPLDREHATELVGDARADELYERSGGNPLFLSELLLSKTDELPASLVDAISTRCDDLGVASMTLRSAAVIGTRIDLDLLAAVLNRPAVDVLDDVELGAARLLLVDDAGTFRFRHALVRTALAASSTAARAAWLHRQVGRVLAQRGGIDPLEIAEHARLGGDVELAAASLRAAAVRAAEHFDHTTAEALLDDALSLHPSSELRLERARVRTRRGSYVGAYEDVAAAEDLGPLASEVGAWASYYDRRLDHAYEFAMDGVARADDVALRARCLSIAGRIKHAIGELPAAESLLTEAVQLATGTDRIRASAWLGVLRAHQSRTSEATELLRHASHPQLGAEHTSSVLHALLFIGHVEALAGHPASAIEAFARYTAEVDRRRSPRFGGRGENFTGWVLRNVGALEESARLHHEALAIASSGEVTPELPVAALEDLAELALLHDDLDGAESLLGQAAALIEPTLVFGWRLELKRQYIAARIALARGDDIRALDLSTTLDQVATSMGVPRYFGAARLLAHRARHRLGERVDLVAVERDLDVVDAAVGIEAWWLTGEVGAELKVERWIDRAVSGVEQVAANAGEHAARLRAYADERIASWQASARG